MSFKKPLTRWIIKKNTMSPKDVQGPFKRGKMSPSFKLRFKKNISSKSVKMWIKEILFQHILEKKMLRPTT